MEEYNKDFCGDGKMNKEKQTLEEQEEENQRINKEFNLSNFIEADEQVSNKGGHLMRNYPVLPVFKVKEKIQNVQRRLNEVINMEWDKGMEFILTEVKEIFEQEFGKKLTEAKE